MNRMRLVASRVFFSFAQVLLQPNRRATLASLALALLGRAEIIAAQTPAVLPSAAPAAISAATATAPAVVSPRFLLKAGAQLTHLFYLPDNQSWQMVFPASLGLEYRLNPRFSLLARAEADIAAGRAPRGRRGSLQSPAAGAAQGLGARYYFNQGRQRRPDAPAEPWGNYLAFETSTDLSAAGRLRGARRGKRGASSLTRLTPSIFVLLGTQHRGPGRHLLYDLSAGVGLEAPPPYALDATMSRPWEMASQVNLRVYLTNAGRSPRR